MPERSAPATVIVAGALLLITVSTGCTAQADATSASSPDAVAARYGYVEASTDLTPSLALVPQFRDPRDDYARDLLARACLTGVIEYAAVPPDELSDPTSDLRSGQGIFDEDVALAYGYPWLHAQERTDTAVPDDVVITDEVLAAMTACGEQADARLGQAPNRFLNEVEAAGWTAVASDPDVADAARRWRSCMDPAGLVDLPDDPHAMPPPSVVTTGPQPNPDGVVVGDSSTPVTERERQVAVADARCRAESGFDAAEHHARVQAELRAIGADVEQFEAVRSEYERYEKGIDAVIAELG